MEDCGEGLGLGLGGHCEFGGVMGDENCGSRVWVLWNGICSCWPGWSVDMLVDEMARGGVVEMNVDVCDGFLGLEMIVVD